MVAKQWISLENINPGKYRIGLDMSNRSIVKMIVNGKQESKVVFQPVIRSKEQFMAYVSEKLE